MKSSIIGNRRYHKPDCFCSSMDWAKEELERVSDGTVFVADRYHQARGQHGRVWQWSPGQCVLTFVLKPSAAHSARLHELTMALTVGVVDPLRRYGVGVVWPNDFFVGHKKVGGILCETVFCGKLLQGIVVGVAINCNNMFCKHDDLYHCATSLKAVVGRPIDVVALQNVMLQSLDLWYNRWRTGDNRIVFRWQDFISNRKS